MNLKKGLSLIAFGFLFLLVDLHLTFNNLTITMTPDFVGWILLTMAFYEMGRYVNDKRYLVIISIIMAVLSGAYWLLELFKANIADNLSIVNTIMNIANDFYMYVLFGILVRIADNYGSRTRDTLSVLRYINLAVSIILLVIGFLINLENFRQFVWMITFSGVVALASAIASAIVLFRLKNEVA